MRFFMKLAALLLTAALSVSGPAAALAETLTIGITQYPSTLNPNIDSMLAKSYVNGMTSRPLSHYDHDWQVTCFLCSELPTLENGGAERVSRTEDRDGLEVTFQLKDELAWGDGTPVTSEDVVFTWEVGSHPDSGISNAELYRRIEDITVHDDKTFTFHLDRVTFAYNSFADYRLLPAHIEREIFEKNPAQYRNRTAFDSDPTNPGLSLGPYRVSDLEPGARITLVQNEHWAGKDPDFERIVVRIFENTTALEANLLSGSIDMIAGELGLSIDQALAFEERHGDSYDILFKPGLIYEHIDLNLDTPILADRRVRQALLYGLDRKAINEQLFQGEQPVALTSVSPLDWIFKEDVPDYSYDPEKAAALLEEAGWSEVRDGVRHDAEGTPLRFEIMTTAGNRTRELIQQVLQSQWQAIGVELVIRNQPPRVLFAETLNQREFDAMALFAWISSPESVPRTTLHSEEIPTAANGWVGQNFTGFANERMDSLIDRIEVELDREKRRELWGELQTLYAEELPALPLFWRANSFILPNWLEGLRPTGHMGTSTLWVEDWHRATP